MPLFCNNAIRLVRIAFLDLENVGYRIGSISIKTALNVKLVEVKFNRFT